MAGPPSARLFIGVEIPAAAHEAIRDIQRRLDEGHPPVRWERLDKLHVTLQFLGATDPGKVPSIAAAIRGTAARHPAHELVLGSAGAFPSLARPNLLWVGVAGAVDALARLQAAVAATLEPLGIPCEARPFHPHVTIGRLRRDATDAARRQIGRSIARLPAVPDVGWTVERIVLFQSVADGDTTRYVAVDAAELL